MPGMSGLELQSALAQQDNSLPLIFLTGHGEIPASVEAMRHGAEDFLTKPVKKQVLFDAITAEIVQRSLREPVGIVHDPLTRRRGLAFGSGATGNATYPRIGVLAPLYP